MLNSNSLFQKAQHRMPGGVNSPVRAFKGVGGTPLFFQRGKGALLFNVEGQQYIDYVGSWGPLILGHAHPNVIAAVTETAVMGLSFGAPCPIEIDIAEKICEIVPSIEMIRMVSSGTEATMAAIRLARGFTGRDKIVKFSGCYHGCSDSLLAKAGSGVLTLGIPNSPGVPESVAKHTITVEYNNLEEVTQIFEKFSSDIAAVIIEPVAGNMNLIPATKSFLSGLRTLCDKNKSLLIFDEVMCGFRVALGGAQAHYSIPPDLTTLGKVIGGGMPVGAFGGSKAIMEHLAPLGPIYQAGTLSGNPVAMAAGLTTLNEICKPGIYELLNELTEQLCQGLQAAADAHQIPLTTQQMGSMFGFFFTEQKELQSLSDVEACNIEQFKQFYHGMLKEGIYLAPSGFETSFMSTAHTKEQIDKTIAAADRVFNSMK